MAVWQPLVGVDLNVFDSEILGLIGTNGAGKTTLFMKISVLDNVFTGYHMSYKTNIWKRLLRTPAAFKEE